MKILFEKMSWNTTKLITVGSLSVLKFLLWVPSVFIFASSGSIFGAAMDLLFMSFFIVLSLLIVQEFGTATIRQSTGMILSLPLPKVLVMPFSLLHVVRGFIIDLIYLPLRNREKLMAILIGGIEDFLMVLTIYLVFITIGLPGMESVPDALMTPLGLLISFSVIFGIGGLSGYLAYVVYQKIKDTSVVRRIQGEKIE